AYGRRAEPQGRRGLAHRRAPRRGDLAADPLDHADVRLEIVRAEDGLTECHAVGAPVAGGVERRRRGEGAGEQAVTEGAIAHDADAVGEAGPKRLPLLAPVEHVIADLRDVDAPGAHALG